MSDLPVNGKDHHVGWQLEKEVHICAGHYLRDYEGPCKNPHGHNYKIIVRCQCTELDNTGFVIDFGDIKKICNEYDHVMLNDLPEFHADGGINPTAENIAKKLFGKIPYCYEIELWETPTSKIIYREF